MPAEHTRGEYTPMVVAVGSNYFGQCNVGDWTDTLQVAAGKDLLTVGRDRRGENMTEQKRRSIKMSWRANTTEQEERSTKMGFAGKVKGFLGSPTATFWEVEPDTLGDALKYALIWFVISGAVFGIIFARELSRISDMIGPLFPVPGGLVGVGFLLIPIMIGIMIVAGVVGIFIGGAWTHLWVYLLGGRKGYTQTVKALAYGATPSYVIGWVPFVGFAGGIWALVVQIIGLRELHGMKTGRAVGAYLLAVLVPVVIVIVITAAIA